MGRHCWIRPEVDAARKHDVSGSPATPSGPRIRDQAFTTDSPDYLDMFDPASPTPLREVDQAHGPFSMTSRLALVPRRAPARPVRPVTVPHGPRARRMKSCSA